MSEKEVFGYKKNGQRNPEEVDGWAMQTEGV